MVRFLIIPLAFGILGSIAVPTCNAKEMNRSGTVNYTPNALTDTVPPADVMDILKAVVYSINNFNIASVANLYTPNAVIADDEPPYSWNGPTAGVQWVNAVEHVCKVNRLTKLKGTLEPVTVYQHDTDNVYVVVPVTYTGILPDGRFDSKGAFTFVLRLTNGKWLIKSQAWLPQKGM